MHPSFFNPELLSLLGLLLVSDAFVVDFNKKTAADYARSKQQNEVLQILEKEF